MEELGEYEVIILGGGPAGLAAGLYTARGRRRTLLLEKAVPGGQIATTDRVENYPGFPEGISGYDLAQRMLQQAEQFGMETLYAEVTGIELENQHRLVRTTEGDFRAPAVIITTGAEPRKLGVPGEERLTGRGVSYCATCDGAFFNDQVVAVAGGGDAALDEGLFLTRYVSKLYIIHRRDQLRASKILQERVFNEPKVEFIWNTVVEEIQGEEEVSSLRLRNVKTDQTLERSLSGLFVFIGFIPNSDFFKGLLALDEGGHVPVDLWMRTAIPGIFAAGDIRQDSARQLATAAGDGVTAAIAAEHYLTNLQL